MTASPGAAPRSFFDRAAVRVAFAVLGLALFAWTLRDFDGARFAELLRDLGPSVGLVLVPHGIASLLHTASFRTLLGGLPEAAWSRPRRLFLRLHGVVLASEAARMALPAGIVVAESVSLVGLTRSLRVRTGDALGVLGVKKSWHLAAHGTWMLLLVVACMPELREVGRALGEPWLPVVAALLVTSTLVTTGGGGLALLASPRAAALVTRVAARLPWGSLRAWADARVEEQRATETLALGRATHLRAAGIFVVHWGAVVLETFVLLRLLGLPVSLTQALVLEMGVVMIRALAFAIPGQVGVQDATYVTLLDALGVAGAPTLAVYFVLLRRAKEAVWIVIGFAIAAIARRPSAAGP